MSVPADDRGLLLADGLFETVLFKAGRAVLWDTHVARLVRGCQTLELPAPDPERLAEAAARALAAAGLEGARAAVRLTWTAGSGGRGLDRPQEPSPHLIVAAAPSARPERPARLALSDIRRNAASPTARIKSLAYLDNVLARRGARATGADEALMLNGQGELCCGAAANLFWIVGDQLLTPSLACGVLDGVMRGQILAGAGEVGLQAVETRAGLAALDQAQAVLISNSLIGVRPVSTLDGRPVGADPRAAALAATLADVS